MKAAILTIGDEILIGQVTDTNATYMANALSSEGLEVVEHLSVADSGSGIRAGVDRALQQASVVLMTGGLGPTKDDITKKVLAEYFSTELVFHEESWQRLVAILQRFGREANDSHRQQCYLPASAEILTNKMGTAPGMLFQWQGKYIFSMPGVPYEMRYLVDQEVMPRLRALSQGEGSFLRSLTMLTAGEGESVLADRIADIEDNFPPHISIAYLPNLGTVRLRLSVRGHDEGRIAEELHYYQLLIAERLGSLLFGYGDSNLAKALGELLLAKGQTVGTAESCTGGRIAQMITNNAGCSAYFQGSIVAYDNAVKQSLLQVAPETLAEHGAVSEATIREMITGGLQTLGTDLLIASSGVAGPGGGSPEKPVGTIWIAVGKRERTVTKLLKAGKDRTQNITFTAYQALNLARLFLEEEVMEGR